MGIFGRGSRTERSLETGTSRCSISENPPRKSICSGMMLALRCERAPCAFCGHTKKWERQKGSTFNCQRTRAPCIAFEASKKNFSRLEGQNVPAEPRADGYFLANSLRWRL